MPRVGNSASMMMASGYRQMHGWWLRGITILSVIYIISSQSLLDVPGWSVVGFAVAALLAMVLAFGHLSRITQLHLGGWTWFPLVFVVYSVVRSLSRLEGTETLGVIAGLLSAYLGGVGVAVAFQSGVPFKALAYAQVVSGLCQIVASLAGIGTESAPGVSETRYSGLTGNANEFGLQLTLGACMIWLLPRSAGLGPCCFAIGAVAYALLKSGSRQALLVLVFFVVLVLIQAWPMLKRHRTVAVLGLCGLLLGTVAVTPLISERLRDITAIQRALEYDTDTSYQARVGMIRQGLALWRNAPLLGNGLDAFRDLSGQGTYAHNDYVELLCDLGLLGVLLFYSMHASIALQAAWLPRALRASCWVLVVLFFALDMGSVGYKRKQSVMILMVLMSITSAGRAFAQYQPAVLKQDWNDSLRPKNSVEPLQAQ